jgi:hypothetical protein
MVKRLMIIACLAAAFLVACSAGGQMKATSPAPARTQTMPAGDPRREIEELDQQLQAERTKMGLSEGAAPMTTCPDCVVAPVEPFGANLPTSKDPVCRPASNDTCRDSCTLSDSICGNAERICVLAQQLQPDKWSADKCTSGKSTCEAAHAKCCSCQ